MKGKVLVIGASGFIGRNLYETLEAQGVDVTGSQFTGSDSRFVCCDLTNYEMTKLLIKDYDYVFMAAAKTYGVGLFANRPEALVRESVVMNANVFHACYETGVKKLLYISSSVVYQDGFKPFTEEDLDLNQETFPIYKGVGWVKRYAEQLASFYNHIGLDVVVVRPTNVYGKYDSFEEGKSHFIPAIIQRCLAGGDKLVVWGSGNNQKASIYIDDFIRNILLVFDRYNDASPINVCSGQLHSIKEIVDCIVDVCGFKGKVVFDPSKPESVPYKSVLINKFDSLIGKQEYTELSVGLAKTKEWLANAIVSNS